MNTQPQQEEQEEPEEFEEQEQGEEEQDGGGEEYPSQQQAQQKLYTNYLQRKEDSQRKHDASLKSKTYTFNTESLGYVTKDEYGRDRTVDFEHWSDNDDVKEMGEMVQAAVRSRAMTPEAADIFATKYLQGLDASVVHMDDSYRRDRMEERSEGLKWYKDSFKTRAQEEAMAMEIKRNIINEQAMPKRAMREFFDKILSTDGAGREILMTFAKAAGLQPPKETLAYAVSASGNLSNEDYQKLVTQKYNQMKKNGVTDWDLIAQLAATQKAREAQGKK